MTTIIYDHKRQEVAVDSRRSTQGGRYTDDTNKIIHEGSLTFILTGSLCDFDYFIKNYEMYKVINLGDVQLDCSGVMIRDGKAYHVFIHENVFNEELLLCNEGFGSGGAFAIAAMDFGKSAKEAIEYAMTKDVFTGGKVQVIDINTMTIK